MLSTGQSGTWSVVQSVADHLTGFSKSLNLILSIRKGGANRGKGEESKLPDTIITKNIFGVCVFSGKTSLKTKSQH